MDDTQIIGLYFSRSESAIAETAKKYGAYLNQVAYNILRCREATEEIVEDTYLAAWNAIPPTKPNVLKHFLSRITRNLAFTRLDYNTAGRRCSNMVALLSELGDCIPDPKSDMEMVWETKQIGASLNRFLDTLERTDCKIFLCRYYYNLTIPEIAAKYDLPQRRVKYRLSCLRKDLRKHLNKEGVAV